MAMMQCRSRVMLATMLLSHAADDAVGVIWLQRDVDVES
jgi:hypothetical protein